MAVAADSPTSSKTKVCHVGIEDGACVIVIGIHVVLSTLQTLEQLEHCDVYHADTRLEGVVRSYICTYVKE